MRFIIKSNVCTKQGNLDLKSVVYDQDLRGVSNQERVIMARRWYMNEITIQQTLRYVHRYLKSLEKAK